MHTRTILSFTSLILAVLLLQGCFSKSTIPSPQQPSNGSVPKGTQRQYTVMGQTYQPIPTARGYVEEGIASWYGDKFHGRSTACGEKYDMYAYTAAHRILPMQTNVLVTNLENGRKVRVRVNDRGPFVKNRIIDLSLAAATALGMAEKGTARVLVRAEESWPEEIPGTFFVQVGSFAVRANALRLRDRMVKKGFRGTRVQQALVDGQTFWRVQVGQFAHLAQANQALGRLAAENPSSFVIAD